jgi:SAM-dependent methyltransferase
VAVKTRQPDQRTRERWAEALAARARAYWTPERRRGLLGDLHLILPPWEAAPLWRALGLIHADASMPPQSVRKYMQISHMVALLEPNLLALADAASPVRILDAGCGSSYLTLLLAWCFRHRWRREAEILGVDRQPRVIRRCRESAAMAGLDDAVRYAVTPLEELEPAAAWRAAFGETGADRPLHVLVALHACDTATDDALALGLAQGAELLAAAPCCQAELARAWAGLAEAGREGAFAPLWQAPHLRREAAATLTDALRALLLRGCGYNVTAMEFVAPGHTPKNTLLRAVRTGAPNGAAFEQYVALRDAVGGADIRLAGILPPGPAKLLCEAAANRSADIRTPDLSSRQRTKR